VLANEHAVCIYYRRCTPVHLKFAAFFCALRICRNHKPTSRTCNSQHIRSMLRRSTCDDASFCLYHVTIVITRLLVCCDCKVTTVHVRNRWTQSPAPLPMCLCIHTYTDMKQLHVVASECYSLALQCYNCCCLTSSEALLDSCYMSNVDV
jgi:hypothetical protein